MIRIASIGYGDIAQRSRFVELQGLSDRARLVAIAGRNESKMQQCAEKFDIPDTYTDVDEMLLRDDIDAVLVLTPPHSHAELALKVIEAGKHVLMEKPMVSDVDEAHAILNAMDGRDQLCFPLPHVSGTRFDLIKHLVDEGAIGSVTSVEIHWGHRGPTHADWFYNKREAGGGVLVDLGIYPLGAVIYMFGKATHINGMLTRRFQTRVMDDGSVISPDVEDDAFVNLHLENKITVSLHATWNGYVSHHDTRTPITVVGRDGMIYSPAGREPIYLHRGDGKYNDISLKAETGERDGYKWNVYQPDSSQVRGVVEEFIFRIEQGDTSQTLLEQQVHVAEIVDALYQSPIHGL